MIMPATPKPLVAATLVKCSLALKQITTGPLPDLGLGLTLAQGRYTGLCLLHSKQPFSNVSEPGIARVAGTLVLVGFSLGGL